VGAGNQTASSAYREIRIRDIVLHYCSVMTYLDRIIVTEDSTGTVTSAGETRN